MRKDLNHYDQIAMVYAYPDGDYSSIVSKAERIFHRICPQAGEIFSLFAAFMTELPLEQQQELYVRSFDVQAITTLDVGYVMFGDDYKRGELLVNLNREHREAGIDCGIELGDHLSNLLRLLPCISEEDIRFDLVDQVIWPGLGRMIQCFDPELVSGRDRFYEKKYKTLIERPVDLHVIYRESLAALHTMLKHDFDLQPRDMEAVGSDFLANIIQESKLEDA